jgi:hypothetical protein
MTIFCVNGSLVSYWISTGVDCVAMLAQLEHRAQMDVFLRQHRGLVGLGGQLQVALAQRVVLVAQRRAGDRDVGRAHEQVARHERRALQRVQHGAEHAADDFERAEARVRHEARWRGRRRR